jgi:hypothetical protein
MPGMKTPVFLSCLLAAGLFSAAQATAGVDISIGAEIRLGRTPPPPPPEVIVVEQVGPHGPPPWAPAHGFRRNRGYYFYPEGNVYYRPADRTWFYLEGSNWRAGVTLPEFVHVDFGHSVSLTMETDRPYVYHQQVVTYYPAGYFTKVKFKERGDRPGPDRDHKPNSKPGRGDKDSGKGKGKDKHRD